MLKQIRIIAAIGCFLLLTLLFLDFTGTAHHYFSWIARMQLLPAMLASNVLILIVIGLLTLLFGRLYCSVICPLGVWQDGISNLSSRRKGKKNRFHYATSKSILRYSVLVISIIALLVGISVIVSLVDPYASFGRIATHLFAPIYRLGNNALAFFSEKVASYAFYNTDVWVKSVSSLILAVVTLGVVSFLAWRNGRIYCNAFCPVGTLLGVLSKFSLFRVAFDSNKCNGCKSCERACKSSCIDTKTRTIDYSRCVSCFNCVEKCKFGGMNYKLMTFKKDTTTVEENKVSEEINSQASSKAVIGRKEAISTLAALGIASTVKAQQLHVDGGLADIEAKKVPERKTQLAPPGAIGINNLKKHCTACQLCISSCPNQVLRPSNKLSTFMQPEMSFERGYCRPECVTCSQVCPTSAINSISTADKTAISVGHAVWVSDNCVVNRDKVTCNNCEHHCPTGAISMVVRNQELGNSLKTPVVNKELCIGCGACENLCPARPFSAIYVEGNIIHHTI